MTLTYTSRLKLAVPDFLTEPWHSEFASAMESIDRMVYDALLMQGAALWLNSTPYIVGDIIISPDNGSLYTCAVANTSTASPQTFTQELVAHPTFWTITSPTLATQAEAEAGVDNTKFMSPLRTKQAFQVLNTASLGSLVTPKAGLLTRSSASQLKFSPYNGDLIKINGVLYHIPPAGIAGLGNTGVIVNAVPGQNLAANTAYLVFANVVSGVVTGYFATSMGFHRPSVTAGNEGVEVYFDGAIESPGRSLIGIIRTNASSQFVDAPNQRFVRSWHNRSTAPLLNNYTANVVIPVSGAFAEISSVVRLEWVNFANEAVFVDTGLPFFQASSLAASINVSLGLDGGLISDAWTVKVFTASESVVTLPLGMTLSPAEGYHFITPTANAATNAVTLFTSGSASNRATFRGLVLA